MGGTGGCAALGAEVPDLVGQLGEPLGGVAAAQAREGPVERGAVGIGVRRQLQGGQVGGPRPGGGARGGVGGAVVGGGGQPGDRRGERRGRDVELDGEALEDFEAVMAVNDAVVPLRPAGGAWTNAHDLARYVQVELSRGVLPDGKRLVSEANLLARRAPQVTVGEDVTYGMGLETDATYGVPVVHHGGSLIGYKSDMMFLPDHGVGAVILTNSEMGSYLLRPFQRRLLEVLFDGVAEAEEDVVSAAGRVRARIAKERERLVVPADPSVTGRLAPRYANAALGEVTVKRQGAATFLDFGEWASTAASRKNDDGTVSVITIDPGADGFELVLGERGSKRTLTMRDAQHEYVFDEK